jgi:hypothetical protein
MKHAALWAIAVPLLLAGCGAPEAAEGHPAEAAAAVVAPAPEQAATMNTTTGELALEAAEQAPKATDASAPQETAVAPAAVPDPAPPATPLPSASADPPAPPAPAPELDFMGWVNATMSGYGVSPGPGAVFVVGDTSFCGGYMCTTAYRANASAAPHRSLTTVSPGAIGHDFALVHEIAHQHGVGFSYSGGECAADVWARQYIGGSIYC